MAGGSVTVLDPVATLVEITQIALDRMNYGKDVTPSEATALGEITGAALRIPEVAERAQRVEVYEY